jgi:inosine triphosphate pyrophosphatase
MFCILVKADEGQKAKIYRKWFMESVGHKGLNNLLAAYTDKTAEAVCTFAYSEGPGFQPIIFQGRTTVRYPTPSSN